MGQHVEEGRITPLFLHVQRYYFWCYVASWKRKKRMASRKQTIP